MSFSPDELKKLILPALMALVLLGAGVALIWSADASRRGAQRELGEARKARTENAQRLARIAEEEREVSEKVEVYKQLKQHNILGPERRLEWADAMTRIRTERELLDLKYRVEKQRTLVTLPGKPGNVQFFASTMKVDLALLHEEDLLRFLADLRQSGNAYYAVKSCRLQRTGQAPTGVGLNARLRAECDVDLITVVDQAAKP